MCNFTFCCNDHDDAVQMRQLHAEVGVVAKADGSALFEMGNTKVIAAVYGPHEVQNHSQQLHDQALVIFLTSLLFYLYFPVLLHYCVFVNES
jgi:ribonuclease PH